MDNIIKLINMIFSRKKIRPIQELDLCCIKEDSKEIMLNVTPIGKSRLKIKECEAFIAENYPLSKELMKLHPVVIKRDNFSSYARSLQGRSFSSSFIVHKNLLKIVSLENPSFNISSYNLEFINEVKTKVSSKIC